MAQKPPPFQFWPFATGILAQFAALMLAMRFLAPAFWARQMAAGPLVLVLTFLAAHLFTCVFEWFFHRYLLHSITINWLQRLAHAHRNHHALTAITLTRDEAGPGRFVLNRYPIEDEDQHPDAMFPPWALLAFWLAFAPFIVVAQLLVPHAPVIVAGFAAVSWAMMSYETLHAIEHLPYEWWKGATEHPRFGGLWQRVYGFHHFHHANVGANEAISGFFGLPVADWLFRTYYQPRELLLTGRIASARDFQVHAPWPWVVALDRWARKREAALRAKGAAVTPARNADAA